MSIRERLAGGGPVEEYRSFAKDLGILDSLSFPGWLDEKRVVLEILTGIQRAGADNILTYHAKDVARWLKAC